jgi:hypothetical protein
MSLNAIDRSYEELDRQGKVDIRWELWSSSKALVTSQCWRSGCHRPAVASVVIPDTNTVVPMCDPCGWAVWGNT